MKFWNKKNKIEFFHSEPSIIENFPIIESKALKLQWAKKAREDFENSVNSGITTKPYFTHLTRCPGIFDLFKYGYVISLHKDLIIQPVDNDFEWHTVAGASHLSQHIRILGVKRPSVDLISKPPWANQTFMVKIETGWHVIAPKGVKFIMLPISYPDTFDFTATTGILNPAVATQINFQLYWNATDKETLIKSGTPLGHIIPISEKKYQMVQRIMNQQDSDWVKKMESAYSSSFSRPSARKNIINMYKKYWKR